MQQMRAMAVRMGRQSLTTSETRTRCPARPSLVTHDPLIWRMPGAMTPDGRSGSPPPLFCKFNIHAAKVPVETLKHVMMLDASLLFTRECFFTGIRCGDYCAMSN